jgi:cytosine/adenosine deaminase-related metal-dependent hydrolase
MAARSTPHESRHLPLSADAEAIDARANIVSAGMIDTHRHTRWSMFHGYFSGLEEAFRGH